MNKEKGTKRELRKVLGLIALYVISMSLFESLRSYGVDEKYRIIPAGCIFIILLVFLRRDKPRFSNLNHISWRENFYLIPMIILSTANLWHGFVIRFSLVNSIVYIVAMLFIGFIEEILFRGYLMELLSKKSVKSAIVVTSLTFGLGHMVNLVSGADCLGTVLQLVYAFAIGIMLSVFVIREKNIVPCCLFHGLFNALAAFSNEENQTTMYQVIVCAIIVCLSVGYSIWLWKNETEE